MTSRPTGLVAILRGVTPADAVAVAEAVFAAGFDAVEVPYNSPDPLESIRRIRAAGPADRRVGAGTVLTPDDVRRAADAGASLIVSPNTRADVVAETVRLGLESYPGAATPTEAFAALDAGARAIKLFPSSAVGIDGMRAWASVLPVGHRPRTRRRRRLREPRAAGRARARRVRASAHRSTARATHRTWSDAGGRARPDLVRRNGIARQQHSRSRTDNTSKEAERHAVKITSMTTYRRPAPLALPQDRDRRRRRRLGRTGAGRAARPASPPPSRSCPTT